MDGLISSTIAQSLKLMMKMVPLHVTLLPCVALIITHTYTFYCVKPSSFVYWQCMCFKYWVLGGLTQVIWCYFVIAAA